MKLHGGCVIACQYCIRAGGTHTLQLENLLGTPKLWFAAPLYEKCLAYFGFACLGGGLWTLTRMVWRTFSPMFKWAISWFEGSGRGQELFGQCPNRRATFHKGVSSVWLKAERKVPEHHYQLSMEYQTILF